MKPIKLTEFELYTMTCKTLCEEALALGEDLDCQIDVSQAEIYLKMINNQDQTIEQLEDWIFEMDNLIDSCKKNIRENEEIDQDWKPISTMGYPNALGGY